MCSIHPSKIATDPYRQQVRAREIAAMCKKAARLRLTLVESQGCTTDV
jgi:hypothetical protein